MTANYQSFSATSRVTVGAGGSGSDFSSSSQTQGMVLEKTLVEMPGYDILSGDSAQLGFVEWLPGGHFVLSTLACGARSEAHGTWVFRPDGSLVQERHGCRDSLAPGADSAGLGLALHVWNFSPRIAQVSATQFVRGGAGWGVSWRYPPMLYEVHSSSVELVNKPFSLVMGDSDPPALYNISEGPVFEPFAVAENRLVAYVFDDSRFGGQPVSYYNAMYSLPDFKLLKKWDSFDGGDLQPVVGVKDYIVATHRKSSGRAVNVYRVVGNDLIFVQKVLDSPGVTYSRDSTNPDRIALREFTSSGTAKVHVYTVGANGLTETGVEAISDQRLQTKGFAIAGNRFAKSFCGDKGCGVEVFENGSKIASAVLPDEHNRPGHDVVAPASNVQSIAFSGDGTRLVVVTYYGAYLYKIGGASSTSPSGCATNPLDPACNPGGDTTILPQLPGQSFTITMSTTSATTPPSVLIRLANILSVSGSNMNISIFGRPYSVDLSHSQILGFNWRPAPLSTFLPGRFVNVWGTLDTVTSTLIHSITVRNPFPVVALGFGSGSGAGQVAGATTSVMSPLQQVLDSLRQVLEALQARLAK